MKYEDIRHIIKTGDLLAWSHDKMENLYDMQIALVRMFTKSEFSHVGVAVVFGGRVFVLESVSSGVRLFPLSRALPFYVVRKPLELSAQGLEWGMARLGDKYESKIKMVIDFFRPLNLSKNHEYQCTELAKGVYESDGILFACPDTPSALVRAAMENWGGMELVV